MSHPRGRFKAFLENHGIFLNTKSQSETRITHWTLGDEIIKRLRELRVGLLAGETAFGFAATPAYIALVTYFDWWNGLDRNAKQAVCSLIPDYSNIIEFTNCPDYCVLSMAQEVDDFLAKNNKLIRTSLENFALSSASSNSNYEPTKIRVNL